MEYPDTKDGSIGLGFFYNRLDDFDHGENVSAFGSVPIPDEPTDIDYWATFLELNLGLIDLNLGGVNVDLTPLIEIGGGEITFNEGTFEFKGNGPYWAGGVNARIADSQGNWPVAFVGGVKMSRFKAFNIDPDPETFTDFHNSDAELRQVEIQGGVVTRLGNVSENLPPFLNRIAVGGGVKLFWTDADFTFHSDFDEILVKTTKRFEESGEVRGYLEVGIPVIGNTMALLEVEQGRGRDWAVLFKYALWGHVLP